MKTLRSELKKISDKWEGDNPMVHFFLSNQGYLRIDPPRFAKELECPFCACSKFYLLSLDTERKAWMCGDVCPRSKLPSSIQTGQPLPKAQRALEWPLFYEINGIGNIHYDVKFENVNQSEGKISYMLKFVTAPRGFILMQGDPGTGKTYAAMAMCELFTRKSKFCIFTTQKQMSNNWLNSLGDPLNNFVSSVTLVQLLVVDDFGTGEVNPKFLEFFMDVINTRMQWDNRGTVMTTNLDSKKFATFCGEALSDRINTGQQFYFKGKTRRKQTIL